MLGVIWRRLLTFLLTFLLVMATATFVTLRMDKVYETTAYLYVTSADPNANDFEQVQSNQVVTKTYSELLQTLNIARSVAERLPFETTGGELQAGTSIAPVPESQLIAIRSSGASPRDAQAVADTYAQVFIESARRLTSGTDSAAAARVTVAQGAPLIEDPVRPRPVLYLAIAALLAVIAATGAALLRHRTDERLEVDEVANEVAGLPLLGRIPRASADIVGAELREGPPSPAQRHFDEAFRFALANLAFVNRGSRPATLAIVSPGQSEGKSTTCLGLARAAQEFGIRTLLIDGDLRRPRLSTMLAAGPDRGSAGLSSFLASAEAMAVTDATIRLDGPDLSLLPSGPIPPNPAALLGAGRLKELEERTRKVFDLVLFDSPPLGVAADASMISAATEGVVLVVDRKRTKRTGLLRAVEQLRRAHANVLGVIINRDGESTGGEYYGFTETELAGAARPGPLVGRRAE